MHTGPGWRLVTVSSVFLAAGSGLLLWSLFAEEQLLGAATGVPGIILVLIANVSFVVTCVTNPGILPRLTTEEAAAKHGHSNSLTIFRTKDFTLKGGAVTVTTKYCATCNIYRLPRCSHCSECNNCVERFDHHCPWLGTCIGRRNHRSYLVFVTSTTILCLYAIATQIFTLVQAVHKSKGGFWRALAEHPASVVLIIYSAVVVWFVGSLTIFHSYLIAHNTTTHEFYRKQLLVVHHQNPYNLGLMGNCGEFFLHQSYPYSLDAFGKLSTDPPKPVPSSSDATLHSRSHSLTGLIPSNVSSMSPSQQTAPRQDDDISMQLSMRSATTRAGNSMSAGLPSLPGDVGSDDGRLGSTLTNGEAADVPSQSLRQHSTAASRQHSTAASRPHTPIETHPIRTAKRGKSASSIPDLSAASPSHRPDSPGEQPSPHAQPLAREDSISNQMLASLQPTGPPGAALGGSLAVRLPSISRPDTTVELSDLSHSQLVLGRQHSSGSSEGGDRKRVKMGGQEAAGGAGSKAFDRTAAGVLTGPSRPGSSGAGQAGLGAAAGGSGSVASGSKKSMQVHEYYHAGPSRPGSSGAGQAGLGGQGGLGAGGSGSVASSKKSMQVYEYHHGGHGDAPHRHTTH